MSLALKPCKKSKAHFSHYWSPKQSRVIYSCPGRGIFRTRALETAR